MKLKLAFRRRRIFSRNIAEWDVQVRSRESIVEAEKMAE